MVFCLYGLWSVMDTVIIPIIENDCSDMTDKGNYRSIALANIIMSKCIELIIWNTLQLKCIYMQTMDNQFGFKRNHSTNNYTCIIAKRNCRFLYKFIIPLYLSSLN